MQRLILAAVIALLTAPHAFSQDNVDAILFLTGASAPEELDQEVFDRFDAFASRPVRINLASESRLLSCGLFSRYQVASITDYRRSSGDILSVAELSLLDGFGGGIARALAPFVSFETRAAPGSSSLGKGRVGTEAVIRGAAQETEGRWSGSGALKLRTGDDERWMLSMAVKEAFDASRWPPDAISGSAALYGRRIPASFVLGDYNVRTGQGLLLWSGFSLSGVQSAAAMDRHPSGISPAWTLSPGTAHRGAAASVSLGRFSLYGFWSHGKGEGANLTWLSRSGQLGLTVLSAGRASADWRWSLWKWDFFGEVAEDFRNRAVAVIAGIAWNPAYQVRLAASVRSYPAVFDATLAGALRSSTHCVDERGAALALDYKKLTFTVDAALHPLKETSQFKAVAKYAPQLTEALSMSLRAVSRYRPSDPQPWRNELRAELTLTAPSGLFLKGCTSCCHSSAFSWLCYAESGFLRERNGRKASVYLRGTAFKADLWDDRIYIYERDIPGAFSVPAYYGRGCSASAVASLKFNHLSFSARAFITAYPGMAEKKPGKAGLRFQCRITL